MNYFYCSGFFHYTEVIIVHEGYMNELITAFIILCSRLFNLGRLRARSPASLVTIQREKLVWLSHKIT